MKTWTFDFKSAAFTLAELLMAVLVISIIMVALAPVITRRAYDSVSIEVNKKKGLEIFTNPGIYSFDVPVGINTLFIQGAAGGGGGAGATYVDKSISYTSSATWSVPQGVNQVTFTITGSGGGGGAGNAKANSGNMPSGLPYNSCKSDEMTQIRGAEDENDLCWTPRIKRTKVLPWSIYGYVRDTAFVNFGQSPPNIQTGCWSYDATDTNYNKGPSAYISYYANGDMCLSGGASYVCRYYNYNNRTTSFSSSQEIDAQTNVYRLATVDEAKKMTKNQANIKYWSLGAPNKLNIGMAITTTGLSPDDSRYTLVGGYPMCIGSVNNHCARQAIWVQGGYMINGSNNSYNTVSSPTNAAHVHCVRPLKKYATYSGAGGASGAKMEKTINVLPSDQLVITIGAGGNGGVYGTNSGKGSQGANTQIIHKRGTATLGTYYVKGGLGGNGASISANGAVYANGTATGQTTPNGTCYASGNAGCSVISYSGEAGTATKGGNGGRVSNSGTITLGGASSGGYLYIDYSRSATSRNTTTEANYAKGQNASSIGFGGGGGLAPAWAASTSDFYPGGKGANGKVDISYRVALPGGGGGAGARVGGYKTLSGVQTMYEIKYKVEEGSRIVFKIGAGGTGGVSDQDGLNGEATVIGDNEIILLAGEGGKISTASQKNSLTGGSGGRASYVNEEGNLATNTLGLIVKGSKVTYTIAAPSGGFKGENGYQGQLKSGTTWLNYGFDGGLGGSPFGIPDNMLNSARSCGGGTKGSANSQAACPNNHEDANRGLSHDPVNNQFGGSGGGGGGVISDSFNLGSGGSGSSGYLRIRWDESEQE